MFSCQEQKGSDSCDPKPCPPPNINDLIELNLSFMEVKSGDQIDLIRRHRSDNSIIDTLQFTLNSQKQITLGNGSDVGFTEETHGGPYEQATLNFSALFPSILTKDISDINIISRTPTDPCGCPD